MNYFSAFSAALLLSLVLTLLFGATADASLFTKAKTDDLYGILGVSRGATTEEIKKAFRRVTRVHHPDVQTTHEAKEEAKDFMVHVLRAYEILTDDIKRQDYDMFGKIDGNPLNSADFTADEIFQHFNMHSPIISKTQQLDSLTLLNRIHHFRGNRIFLIQIYDDTCQSCRWFSPTWETFAQSSLADGGVLVMLRIDALSPEGPSLLARLGVRPQRDVRVIAIVDGVAWPAHELSEAVQVRSSRAAHRALHEMIMGFLYDRHAEVAAFMPNQSAEDIVAWLQEPSEALRVLVPPLATEFVPVTLSLVHDSAVAVVRAAPRASLLRVVEHYCGGSVELRDRAGELMPMPEFLVVASAPLREGNHPGERNCKALEIGVSAAMTYRKAAAFVEEHLPKQSFDVEGIPKITGMNFFTLCQRHCLLWLRQNCRETPNADTLATLKADYSPFVVGYVCLDTELTLRSVLPESIYESGGAFVALVDGSDEALYVVPVTNVSSVTNALSDLLAEENVQTPLVLSSPISTLLVTQPFPLKWLQRLTLLCLWILSYIAPIWTNSYPFLLMYISHRIMIYFKIPGISNPTPNNNSGDSNRNNETSRSNENSASTSAQSTQSPTNLPESKANSAGDLTYTVKDLEAAKDGRGFLFLLVPHGSLKPDIPSILRDARFSVRIIPQEEKVWRSWVAEHRSSTEEEGFSVVALRKGRMTAAVKPSSAALEDWVCDLVDGTLRADKPIPAS